ncbi:hypothetical protein ACFC06_21645 [Nocardia sp. NPDC056064]
MTPHPTPDPDQDVSWPDPSPLQSWWDEVMRPAVRRRSRAQARPRLPDAG